MYWDIKEGNKLINNCIQVTTDILYYLCLSRILGNKQGCAFIDLK